MNKLPISVVLPFYQAEQTLARAIQAILNQSFKEFEFDKGVIADKK